MLKRAKEVLNIEAKAITRMARRLGPDFEAAVTAIARCSGRVIVCGMGKSGIVGRKIAATLSSTGNAKHIPAQRRGSAWRLGPGDLQGHCDPHLPKR